MAWAPPQILLGELIALPRPPADPISALGPGLETTCLPKYVSLNPPMVANTKIAFSVKDQHQIPIKSITLCVAIFTFTIIAFYRDFIDFIDTRRLAERYINT